MTTGARNRDLLTFREWLDIATGMSIAEALLHPTEYRHYWELWHHNADPLKVAEELKHG